MISSSSVIVRLHRRTYTHTDWCR